MRILVVVGCTKAKHLPVPEALCLHTVPRGPVTAVAAAWRSRLRNAERRVAAVDLYGGPSWTDAKRALARARRLDGGASLAVMSAGFGLVAEDELLPGYSATFSDDRDAVHDRLTGDASSAEAGRLWWAELRQALGDTRARADGLLAAADLVCVAVGAEYLSAGREDMASVAARLGPDRLAVVSAGSDRGGLPPALAECLLPIGTEWEIKLPGVRAGLNNRALRWLLEESCLQERLSFEAVRRQVDAMTPGIRQRWQARPKKTLIRCTDEAIVEWVISRLHDEPSLSVSELLRRFRQERSCEQSRFRLLADQARRTVARGNVPIL